MAVPIKLDLQKQAVAKIWPTGYSWSIPVPEDASREKNITMGQFVKCPDVICAWSAC